MVGIKLFNPNPLGLVSAIATLFVAGIVSGEPGVVFNTENKNQISLECDGASTIPWTVEYDKLSPEKKIFSLSPETKGCFKSKIPIALNVSEKFIVKFHYEHPKDESGRLIIRLVPEGGQSCPDEECIWEVSRNSQLKEGEWDIQEHTFPLKAPNQYTVQLSAENMKGKFFLRSLEIPNAKAAFLGEAHLDGVQEHQLSFGNGTGGAVGISDFGKNILFTTASVLTLNNILN